MKIKIYDGIRLLTYKNGKPMTFRSKRTAYKYLKKIGRREDVGLKIKLYSSF